MPNSTGKYAAQMALTELAPIKSAMPVTGSHLITTGSMMA